MYSSTLRKVFIRHDFDLVGSQQPIPDGSVCCRRASAESMREAVASVRTDFRAFAIARVLFGPAVDCLRTSRSKSALPAARLRGGVDRIAPSRRPLQAHTREQPSCP